MAKVIDTSKTQMKVFKSQRESLKVLGRVEGLTQGQMLTKITKEYVDSNYKDTEIQKTLDSLRADEALGAII